MLIAVLITAMAITAVVSLHANNLRKVSDQVALNQAHLILNNTIYRLQQKLEIAHATSINIDLKQITEKMQSQIIDAGLKNANLTITPENNGWLVQIDWLAHHEKDPIQRVECRKVPVEQHCLALWIAP